MNADRLNTDETRLWEIAEEYFSGRADHDALEQEFHRIIHRLVRDGYFAHMLHYPLRVMGVDQEVLEED
jgi:hypothetical protein